MLNSALILPVTFVPLEHIIWPQCVHVGVGISRMLVPISGRNMSNVLGFLIYCFCLPHFTNSTFLVPVLLLLKEEKLKKIQIKWFLCRNLPQYTWHGNMLISEEKTQQSF